MTQPTLFSRLTGRLFLTQWVGNFLLMLLAAAWLQIPDSHSWQFVFSVLSGVLLVVGFLWLYVSAFRRLRLCEARPPWWQSCLLLAVFVALYWLLLQPIAVARAHEALFAGYWNAMSPPWLRYHFGYSTFVAWQEHFYDCVQWLCAGLLLPLAVETCACGLGAGSFQRAVRVYRHWLYWICVLVCGLGGAALTWALADWTQPASLATQTFSILARLGIAYTLDILLWCFVLALAAHYLDRQPSAKTGPAIP
jgi:hypothetical protein